MKHWWIGAAGLASFALMTRAAEPQPQGKPMKGMTTAPYGQVDGKPVTLYTLTNANGAVVKIITYGGIVTELHVPDKDGKMADVVLGFDNLDGYLDSHPYFGAIVGRVRQPHRQGQVHPRRQGLHAGRQQRPEPPARRQEGVRQGGLEGRAGEQVARPRACELHYRSPDGEEGYPGNLDAHRHLHARPTTTSCRSTTSPRPTRRRRST